MHAWILTDTTLLLYVMFFSLLCTCKMFQIINDPAVIRFLNARNVKPAEIHRQLKDVYGETMMCDGTVRKYVRMFNDNV